MIRKIGDASLPAIFITYGGMSNIKGSLYSYNKMFDVEFNIGTTTALNTRGNCYLIVFPEEFT